MTESRLQRWSRQKAEARREAELAPPTPVEPQPTREEQELAVNETLPERDVLEKYGLPDPDAIVLGTDITGFMRKEIPDLLRRKALRALWKSNPVLAVLDGLNDYDEDFSDAATATEGVKTLYRVGQGLIEKRTPIEARTEDRAETQAMTMQPLPPEKTAGHPLSDSASEPLIPPHQADPVITDAEAEPPPRYRPRMRFDQ
ncbi:DUF3306 domain-containing protein [Marinobacter arenosus]|uniref:DUF3306 domain-containing protein n=1 Tax=Marinobacter arenosus TaxID=2856822 RepID=UPI001C4C693F|nr:DUF3306 domain-containing protein [Marinobacter arenosus]MBW0148514.1 DUF3306 domain-containing protein [Marinobacter arenosus]